MGSVELLEREAELEQGRALVARARAGHGGVLLVEGPAGIGKTALLAAIREHAGDLRVLAAVGDELDTAFAFGVARQLFERLLTREPALAAQVLTGAAAPAAAIVDVRGEAAPPASAEAARHALTWLTANLAEQRPVLLCLDDLQWADAASTAWVQHLVRRVDDIPLAVLAGWRTGEPGADERAHGRLLAEPAVTVVRPRPLTRVAAERLVRRSVPEATPELCAACSDAGGGNPFLLAELARMLGATAPDVAPSDVMPETVARSVAQRLARLPSSARRAAEACAVLGDGADVRHVEAVAGLPRGEVVAALDALGAAEILRPGRPLAFAHPLVRRAVHDALSPHARAQAHGDAARVLLAEGADELRVASHLLQAAPSGDPHAADVLRRAARRALDHGAPTEAAALLERAVADAPAEERTALLVELGVAQLRHGDPAGEGHLRTVVATAPDPQLRGRAALALSRHLLFQERRPDLSMLVATRAALDGDDTDLSLALAACAVSGGIFAGDGHGAAAQEIAHLVRTLPGATPAQRELLAAVTFDRAVRATAQLDDDADLAERAAAGGRLAADGPDALPAALISHLLLVADRTAAAQALIDAGLRTATEQGSELGFAIWSGTDCYRGWLQGDLVAAEASGRAALAASGSMDVAAATAACYLALALVDRGMGEEAERLVVHVWERADDDGLVELLAGRALLHLRMSQARWSEAAETALALGRRLTSRGMAEHPGIMWRSAAAVALAAQGDRAQATELLAAQRAVRDATRTPRREGALLRAEGLVAGGTDGIAVLEAAVAVLGPSPARLEHARALADLGAMQRRAGRRAAARDTLRLALDAADRCGAVLLADHVRVELAATGAKPRRTRLTGIDALTPSELRVARMAAGGMGNREIAEALFVTRKTIETQLRSVYRKLDITSREALPDALTE